MDLSKTITSTLTRRKNELEYAAQMYTLESVEVSSEMQEEYLSLKEELDRRAEIYRASCISPQLQSAVDDWFAVIATGDLEELTGRLSDGYEAEGAQIRKLNPLNPFFKEILLKARDNSVQCVEFFPSGELPLDWLKENFPEMSECRDSAAEEQSFVLLRVIDGHSGRIHFLAELINEEVLITRVTVWRWSNST